jgi:hypothetical protein
MPILTVDWKLNLESHVILVIGNTGHHLQPLFHLDVRMTNVGHFHTDVDDIYVPEWSRFSGPGPGDFLDLNLNLNLNLNFSHVALCFRKSAGEVNRLVSQI